MSKVTHYEGATAGTNLNSGYKRFQAINKLKFVEKWRDVLDGEHQPKNAENVLTASNRMRGNAIAVFDVLVPEFDRDSGSVRMLAILQGIAKNNRVVMTSLKLSNQQNKYIAKLGEIGVEFVAVTKLLKQIKDGKIDFAILSRPEAAAKFLDKIRRISPQTQIIYDSVDAHSVRFEREYHLTSEKSSRVKAKKFKEIETSAARNSNQVWCVTEQDKVYFQELAANLNVKIVPNIHSSNGHGKCFAETRDLMFIGSYAHRPNLDAVIYFLDEIFPLLQKEMPEIRFHVVGSDVPAELASRESDGVRIEGYVENVAPLFESCRVFVAPLRYGAGMKGKIGQALSFGLPTVTTDIGAEGMNLRHENEAMIANEPNDFAQAVIKVYQDELLWQKLAANGYKFIADNLSATAVETKITDALDNLKNNKVIVKKDEI
ncbi:MAG: glycosyltransferase [Pyrinomonadaceae bacterium]|nr:glycosyltransferase [Pyrinomonadaceae bacterium]